MRKVRDDSASRLEGLCQHVECSGSESRLRIGSGAHGIERLEASFTGLAFSAHRHDTYAIGITVRGVQAFRYRGAQRYCLPGEGHILHPDETHDGVAGTEAGFGYRILHVDPSLIQQALGGKPLPFVADPIVKRGDMHPGLIACLDDIDSPLDEIERVDITLMIVALLERLRSGLSNRRAALRLASLQKVRDLIADDPCVQHPAKAFEQASGLDRWTIARHFRAAFGTSPSRFRTMRQLDRAREMMDRGVSLSEAALAAGFADQSHMSRMFKRVYGLTPARWLAALASQ